MHQYSQLGQAEWILNHLFKQSTVGNVLEVGAHSPTRISNSMSFIQAGWHAYLIEREKDYCHEWQSLQFPKVSIYNHSIDYTKKGLDIVARALPCEYVDVIFLDIDGGEYQLLDGLTSIKPSVVCVEYDNSYPLSVEFVPKAICHGKQASALAFVKLMASKGYLYVRSFFQDMVFIETDYHNKNTAALSLPVGLNAYEQYANSSLYNPLNVVLGQDELDGGASIRFYAKKLTNLYEDKYFTEFLHMYHFFNLVLPSYLPVLHSVKSQSYISSFNYELERFRTHFARLATQLLQY